MALDTVILETIEIRQGSALRVKTEPIQNGNGAPWNFPASFLSCKATLRVSPQDGIEISLSSEEEITMGSDGVLSFYVTSSVTDSWNPGEYKGELDFRDAVGDDYDLVFVTIKVIAEYTQYEA